MKDSGYLVFDWREGEITGYHKTRKAKLSGHEKRIPVSIEAETPDINVEAAAGEINVTEGDVRAVLSDELVDEPKERLDTEANPVKVVFEIDYRTYEEQIDEFVEELTENPIDDELIDWWRILISAEHRKMNRPQVLNYMEEKLEFLKRESEN